MHKEQHVENIISLLEEKNNHLELFLLASEKERRSFKARNFDNVEDLYSTREQILENLKCIDIRIEAHSIELNRSSLTPSQKEQIQKSMKRREKIVGEIMSQDLVILSCIENEKSTIIKKLSSISSGRRLMNAYKNMPDIID